MLNKLDVKYLCWKVEEANNMLVVNLQFKSKINWCGDGH